MLSLLAFGSTAAVSHQAAASPNGTRGRAAWKPIPEATVTTHEGKTVRFHADLIAGRIAVIDFIYTDCTFICAPQGRTFAGLSEMLGSRLGRDVVLISVSLAPERDTPQALASWAANLGGAAPGWFLVTGKKKEIGKLIRNLAGFVSPQYHDGAAVIVDEQTRTRWYFNGTEAPRAVWNKIDAIVAARTAGK
jgi:protein SCO1